jgi:hypothetical protein
MTIALHTTICFNGLTGSHFVALLWRTAQSWRLRMTMVGRRCYGLQRTGMIGIYGSVGSCG